MRTLLVGALAATLVGCSCPLRQQADANSCADLNGYRCFDRTVARDPIEPTPVSFETDSAPLEIKPAIAVKTEKPSSARASDRAGHRDLKIAKSTVIAAKVEPPASRIPLSTPTPAKIEPAKIEPAKTRSLDGQLPASNTADDAVANSNTRAIREQVESATAVAELLTVATLDHAETHTDGQETASEQPNKTDLVVYLLIARPEIKLVSDLTSKIIAVDEGHSGSGDNVRIAIAAAGAPEVKLSGSQANAVDRVFSGEVAAAVLTAVSPEAAESFPDVPGYKIFRIPLSPRSSKARP
ncbi:hypothetical protein [Bradyrhizobium canariense]|uniref:Uncharacterized protein n=1 Tax=Bradyrhizobium canariense TaxID=255045 RepID=A0A1H1WUQ9_9BRAD|nr:hypothetical protein [Bradyrhizobium canariense]SDT00380.1 hypothetical protein SAMN05444158_4005 [Bradyrhizobium canariense]